MVSSAPRPAAIDRSVLIRGGLFGALANALVAGSPLYAPPLQDALWREGGDGRLLLLVGIALALFATHAVLDFERARSLGRLAPAGLDRVWMIDAGWVPVHLLVLGWVHPVLGVLALAGVAAVAAMIALCAADPAMPQGAASGPWQGERRFDGRFGGRLDGGVLGRPDAFQAGMRFCETVYRVLVVALAAALLVRGELQPGAFVAGALIGVAALRSAVRAAALWRGCGGLVGDAP